MFGYSTSSDCNFVADNCWPEDMPSMDLLLTAECLMYPDYRPAMPLTLEIVMLSLRNTKIVDEDFSMDEWAGLGKREQSCTVRTAPTVYVYISASTVDSVLFSTSSSDTTKQVYWSR